MSIDWNVQIERACFRVRELIDRTDIVLATLLGANHGPLAAYDDVRPFIAQRPRPTPVSHDFLEAPCGSANPGFIVALANHPECAVSVVFVRVVDKLEDPESGDWMSVCASMIRTPASFVLGIAVAIAVGMLAGEHVIDEACLLGDQIAHDLNALIATLSAKTHGAPLVEAAAAVIARTKLRSPPASGQAS